MNFFETVRNLLKQDERFFAADGEFLRNAVYEAAMQMDTVLIKLLLSNSETKTRFFSDVEGVLVFDKVGFGWVINNRQFLPNSYTRYKNRIGLTNERSDLISTSGYVELVFPYKDCVLTGGQTKEDQKRSEIFYNTTLAPDEVDRLLFPKAFCNATRYTKKGKESITELSDTDNLIIKGNNLLSISSLLKKYEGQVKCIYIDVPYNTGNDSFGYNDRFNHSSWLTFMKNRLEIAHKLLSREGTIAISIDNYEIGYLQVLLDEIFGRENRKNIITVKRGSVTGAKVINPGVVNIVEYVVLYSKDTSFWRPNRVFSAKGIDDRYGNYIINFDAGYSNWQFSTVLEAFAVSKGCKKSQLKRILGSGYNSELEHFVITNARSVCQFATLDDNNISQEARELKQKSIENPDAIFFLERDDGKPYYVKSGKLILFASDRIMEIDGKLTFSQPITDIWDDVLPNDLHNEGGVELKKGKKPEKLLERIISLCSDESDMVVDFFAGSGTTGAVALKMKRQFILCEQMDYIETTTVQRLINVVAGETRGVSVNYNWTGGGSFVYCELAKQNQTFIEHIRDAEDDAQLCKVWANMHSTGYISHYVDPRDIDETAADFKALSFEDKKHLFLDLLDKNLLYVNYCDMDDAESSLSEADKAFTRCFYEEV